MGIVRRIASAAWWLILAPPAYIMFEFNYYVFFGNEVNHTGIPVRIAGIFLLAAAAITGVIVYVLKLGYSRKLLVATYSRSTPSTS